MLDQYAENAALYRDAAQMFMKNECYEAAASICRKAIEGKFGDSADLHWILGQATAKLQQYEKAVPAYEKAIELSSAGRIRELIEKELAELCTHEPVVEQIPANKLRSLRGIEQRLTELYWEKAVAAEQQGNLAEARTLYQRIAHLVPDSDTGRAAEKKIQELGNP
jgi:tetratricopeptide (TPR) repeat protein